jgi:hypothetical protein
MALTLTTYPAARLLGFPWRFCNWYFAPSQHDQGRHPTRPCGVPGKYEIILRRKLLTRNSRPNKPGDQAYSTWINLSCAAVPQPLLRPVHRDGYDLPPTTRPDVRETRYLAPRNRGLLLSLSRSLRALAQPALARANNHLGSRYR